MHFRRWKRRQVITLLGKAAIFPSLLWPLAARGEAKSKMLRVGYVGVQLPDAPLYQAFRNRMAELGYQEGRNFSFEYIQTPDIEGYGPAYRQLAAREVDIFFAVGEPGLRAARAASGPLPIALLAVDFDPLAKGYVASLARPGGNITGIVVQQMELAAKRIEFLREVFPQARRIGLVSDASSRDQIDTAADAARSLGFVPLLVELTGPHPDYGAALRRMSDAQAVVIPAGPLFMRDRVGIAEALTQAGIPSICAFREIAEAGALMSYGVDLAGLFRDMADYVDRIAKGGKPADLPIEHATRFHMAINLKAAVRLGVSLSNTFTARANEVFE
jgi:putative tryptophan/tyrosine transport system substrate-binding protein